MRGGHLLARRQHSVHTQIFRAKFLPGLPARRYFARGSSREISTREVAGGVGGGRAGGGGPAAAGPRGPVAARPKLRNVTNALRRFVPLRRYVPLRAT